MYSNIRKALVKHYQGLGLLLPTEYENSDKLQNNHIRFDFIPNTKVKATLGKDGIRRATGLLQLLVKLEINQGSGESMDLADQITEHFDDGLRLTEGDTVTTIKNSTAGASYTSAIKYVTPITITWQSDRLR